MRDDYDLSELAAATLDELRSLGITPSDSEIVRLNALGWDVEHKGVRSMLSRGKPIECGGAWLWPMTIAADEWYAEIGSGIDPEEYAIGYAMAHGSDPLLMGRTGRDVRKWARSLRCSRRELQTAIYEVSRQTVYPEVYREAKPGGDAPMTAQERVSIMIQHFGGAAAHWESDVAHGYIAALVSVADAQQRAGERDNPVKQRAVAAFMFHVEHIKARHAKESETGG
jgi:hypothetical protein